ncbi:MAG: DUF5674 family protein [bacterium]
MNGIKIIDNKINLDSLREMAHQGFGDFVKVVVDIEQKIMAINGDMHSDEEATLLKHGSKQENLWGINIYPDLQGENYIEFDSMINIRPRQGNRSRNVEDFDIQRQIREAVANLIG